MLLLPERQKATPGNLPSSNALSKIGEHWIEKYQYFLREAYFYLVT
jgi:hypothetical protein